jgi:hypothetical protein
MPALRIFSKVNKMLGLLLDKGVNGTMGQQLDLEEVRKVFNQLQAEIQKPSGMLYAFRHLSGMEITIEGILAVYLLGADPLTRFEENCSHRGFPECLEPGHYFFQEEIEPTPALVSLPTVTEYGSLVALEDLREPLYGLLYYYPGKPVRIVVANRLNQFDKEDTIEILEKYYLAYPKTPFIRGLVFRFSNNREVEVEER